MPNGDLTWKEVLIIAALWLGHVLFVLPPVGIAWLLARCPVLPRTWREGCRDFIKQHVGME